MEIEKRDILKSHPGTDDFVEKQFRSWENRGLLEDELVKRDEFCLRALLAASVEWKRA